MSSALVRQALAFVDPEENAKNKCRSRRGPRRVPSQYEGGISRKSKNKKIVKVPNKTKKQLAEENLKRLLLLSQPTADSALAEKLIERALTGKPLTEKIEIKTEEEKSILFPEEETFKDFEKELFCN